jgi:malonyl-CoA/methylmalonyl-CoA synthetase
MTLLDFFDASVAADGAALALNEFSYAELAAATLRVAHLVREHGVAPGDRVVLFCENRPAFVITYLAVLRLGAIAVPANVLYRASDLAHVLDDADAALVLASSETRVHLGTNSGVLMLDADVVDACAGDPTAPQARDLLGPEPDAPALIVYTSGTTGRSKGAVLTHGNLAVIAAQLVTAWRWTAADTLAIALPLFHVHGLCAALNGSLACGARLLLHQRFDAATMLATLQMPGVTMFFGVPTMYVRLLELPDPVRLPTLRLAVSGSAALSAEIFERFRERFGVTILERYGATEFGFALGNRYGGPRIAGSVGIPFPGVRVRVVDESSRAVPHGAVGELVVHGPNVFAGYWRNPDATRAAFVVDADGTRWYRSGDLADYDPGSQTYRIVGRLKDLIVSGGFNVYPLEVETEIERFPGIRASAVVGAPDPVRGESVVAFVETESGAEVDALALVAWLRERVASFKIPKDIRTVASLPRNALGKIEKTKLRALVRAGASAVAGEHRGS